VRVCATDQHGDLLDPVLNFFSIRPDHRLRVMKHNQTLGGLTARLLERLSPVLADERPDLVVVQGDTTTALAAALSAYYFQIPVAHVEAGLRSGDKFAPFPEEMNRRLITRLADYHFAPTPHARDNLLAEGIRRKSIAVTGNTAIDAVLAVARRVRRTPRPPEPVAAVAWGRRRVVLVTLHRRESFGAPLRRACEALAVLAERNPRVEFVFPVHPNPQVRPVARTVLAGRANVHLVEPLDYLSFVWCMARASLIITDSGGIQEEAPSLGVPVLVARNVTERVEGIVAGMARLVGTDRRKIIAEAQGLLDETARRKTRRKSRPFGRNPYGDGRASERIAAFLAGIVRPRIRETT
jgi:UDP-N-acetylglucosamine 2-epimerase